MPIYRAMVARSYDFMMRKVERLCLQRWRAELLAGLYGDTLEIGAGTGLNLPHYPKQVRQLFLCEPDQAMRKQLESALCKSIPPPVVVHPWVAEQLEIDDCSIDHLVSTLVFCSVDDPRQAMREAFRVIKPGGKLIFMEHVAAERNSQLHFWQKFWQPLWRPVACNCHLTRQTALFLEEAGFKLEMRHEIMRGAPAIAAPMIIGCALRP